MSVEGAACYLQRSGQDLDVDAETGFFRKIDYIYMYMIIVSEKC